jgi:hypothetical protein
MPSGGFGRCTRSTHRASQRTIWLEPVSTSPTVSQRELCTPGTGGRWGPGSGNGSQQESNSTSIGRIRCRAAIPRKASTRCTKPAASCSQSRSWRNTRIVFMPSSAAQPSSWSITTGAKVSACHISSWLAAVEGTKLAPTSQGCCRYHSSARASGQRCGAAATARASSTGPVAAVAVRPAVDCRRNARRPRPSMLFRFPRSGTRRWRRHALLLYRRTRAEYRDAPSPASARTGSADGEKRAGPPGRYGV